MSRAKLFTFLSWMFRNRIRPDIGFESSLSQGCIRQRLAHQWQRQKCSSRSTCVDYIDSQRTASPRSVASSSSPARIGPTPDGVPVKITSPGKRVSDCGRKSDNFGYRINHLTGPRTLSHFAILPQLNRQIADLDVGINKRTDRRVGIERFAAAELFFGFLQIAIADIETDGVAKDKIGASLSETFFARLPITMASSVSKSV